MQISLWKKISLGFILIFAFLTVISIKIYDGISDAHNTTKLMRHTGEVVIQVNHLLSLLKDIETAQRGYIITGKDEYLEPYTRSLPNIWTQLASVTTLTADNPSHQQRIEILKPIIREKIESVQKTIAQRNSEGFEVASATLRTGQGKRLMDTIRVVVSAMVAEERIIRAERTSANNNTFQNTKDIIIYGSLAALSIIIILGVVVTYTTTKSLKELLKGTNAISNNDLSYRVHVSSHDEIGTLATAFNSMAQKLMDSKEEIKRQNDLLEEETAQLQLANVELNEKNHQLHELNSEKNEFLGIVAHDLKNPLFGIKGLSQILEKEYKTLSEDEVKDFSTDIRISADRMFELISNLLDINAIERNGVRMEIQPFTITPVAEHAFNRYKQRAQSKNITMQFIPHTTCEVLADRSATMQVLDNVISNAVKYSPFNKTVTVRVYVHEGKTVRIQVADQGPGFTEEDKKKLFGKFARLSSQPTGGEHSTGLGLSIVKKLVEAMNGKIWCESEIGKGSIFIIELPKA